MKWFGAGALVAWSSVAGAAPDPACVVAGDHVTLDHVIVHLDSGATLDLLVQDVPIVATLGTRAPTALAIDGAIAFRATAASVWFSLDTRTTSSDGLVVMGAWSRFVADHADGPDMIGNAVLYSDDVMQGEAKFPNELVADVRVACDRVSLEWRSTEQLPRAKSDGTQWQSIKGKNRLELHREPRLGAPSVVDSSPNCADSCFSLVGIDHRAGWREVAAQNEGVAVTGWVPERELTLVPNDVGLGYSYECGGHHFDSRFNASFFDSTPAISTSIKIGTTIFAAPGKDAWAVVRTNAAFDVVKTPGSAWAEVIRIPGVVRPGLRAYVPVSALVPAP